MNLGGDRERSMKITFVIGLFSLVLGAFGCAKTDTGGPSAAEREAESKKKVDDIQKILSRKDEFASMKPPVKLQKGFIPGPSFIMFRMPGAEYELVGWEPDSGGKMSVCLFKDCNKRDISPLFDLLPKEGKLKWVIRADCKAGKKLGDLTVATAVDAGGLFESVCDVSVIDVNSNTVAFNGTVTADKYETDSSKRVLEKSVARSGDKKSTLVVPIAAIEKFLDDQKK